MFYIASRLTGYQASVSSISIQVRLSPRRNPQKNGRPAQMRGEEKFALSLCQKKMIKETYEYNEVEIFREMKQHFSFSIPSFLKRI